MINFIQNNLFGLLVILLFIAVLGGFIALRLRQPLIIGFIAIGIIAGPSALNWLHLADKQVHIFAEMGLAFLLFIVGLKLDLQLIRSMGKVAVIIGFAQVLASAIGAFLISIALGIAAIPALFIAIALTFSSTIIIVKLLSDKHETDSLHGRLILGILIVQDLVAILSMLVLSASAGENSQHPLMQLLFILLKGAVLIGGIWLSGFVILPQVLPLFARSTELLILFAIGWALLLAFVGQLLGFGQEIGAFLAGVSLASTEYREIIGAKLVSLRDFMLLFFFVNLGGQLDLSGLGSKIIIALVLALYVLLGKSIMTMVLVALMGYRKRTGFMVGLSLAQISEFSLIVIAMGAANGFIDKSVVGIVTLVGLITIGLSSYLIQFSQEFYQRLSPRMRFLDKVKLRSKAEGQDSISLLAGKTDVILFGIGGYGSGIAREIVRRGHHLLAVDFDPQAVSAWQNKGGTAIFGDAEDYDFASSLPLSHVRWVISSIRDQQINAALIQSLRHAGYTGNIAFSARERAEGEKLVEQYAGLLFVPSEDAAIQAVDILAAREKEILRETMDKLIERMKDHYIVCGYGRMGQQIAKDFTARHVPYVVVENNPEQLPKLEEENIPHVDGNASHDETLLDAGIKRARGLIAVASSDEQNVFIVLSARGLNPDLYIVARSIREENEDKLRRAGANRVMSPYILGGRRMAAAVTRPGVMDFIDLVLHSESFDTEIGHITVPQGSLFSGQAIRDISLWQSCGVIILAVQRPDSQLLANPGPDFVLQEGDELILMGSQDKIDAAENELNRNIGVLNTE